MIVNLNNIPQALQKAFDFLQKQNPLEAEKICTQILAEDPKNIQAHFILGNSLSGQGKHKEAAASFQNALQYKPNSPEINLNLANALKELKRLKEAAAHYQKALTVNPNYFKALVNYGNLLIVIGSPEEASVCCRKAVYLQPDAPDALNNLGVALTDQREFGKAVACFKKALTLTPENSVIHYNLGRAYREQGLFNESITSYRQALSIRPDYTEAYNGLGQTFRKQGNYKEAKAAHQKALSIQPDNSEAYKNIAAICCLIGEINESLANYRKALFISPDFQEAHSGLLFTMNYEPDIIQQDIYNESLLWGARLEKELKNSGTIIRNSADTGRRLKVGYVSADFRRHSLSYFLEPLLKAHDRDFVEIFCYSNLHTPDDVTARLQQYADHWRHIASKNDDQVSEQIINDEIDILVDLSGHTAGNRLMVFARKPAPVQLTWLGYVNTTGLHAIDYHIVDSVVVPDGEEKYYTEQMVRLPTGFVCFNPPANAPEVQQSPITSNDTVTFGSVNNLIKINPEVIALWSEILTRRENSRLLFQAKPFVDHFVRDRYAKLFEEQGIAVGRVEFVPSLSAHEFLKLHNRIDIALDPFPFNGITTTCNTLWMGVPVITLMGERYCSRMAASALKRLGLDELIANTKDEYVTKAIELATNAGRLNELRMGMRDRMLASPLCDAKGFAQTIEEAYADIWQQYEEKGAEYPSRGFIPCI